jgi:hypothetical protein
MLAFTNSNVAYFGLSFAGSMTCLSCEYTYGDLVGGCVSGRKMTWDTPVGQNLPCRFSQRARSLESIIGPSSYAGGKFSRGSTSRSLPPSDCFLRLSSPLSSVSPSRFWNRWYGELAVSPFSHSGKALQGVERIFVYTYAFCSYVGDMFVKSR